MHRERLRQLFQEYDPDIQAIITDVLQLEQEYITMNRPHLKDPIDDIIDEVAKLKLGITKKPRTARA